MDPALQNVPESAPLDPRDGNAAGPDENRTSSQPYRRNGKPFACEPCRRGKLRCDHSSPTCGRCLRRKKPEQCIYHPAPLTKPRDPPGAASLSIRDSSRLSTVGPYPTQREYRLQSGLVSPPSSACALQRECSALRPSNGAESSVARPPPQQPMPPASMIQTPVVERRASSSVSGTSPEGGMPFREGKVGFLGPTSYSAVFTENPTSLGDDGDEAEEDAPNFPPVTEEKIQQGAEVLALLRDMPLYKEFTQRFFELCDGLVIIQPIFRIWIDELWSEFGRLLVDGKPDQLFSLSELVWRNTRRSMKIHGHMAAKEWAKAASGRNLRWETVGIILSFIGLIACNLSNWDKIFDTIRDRYVDRATFAERMRKVSEFCLCFCYESEVLNDIYVCFMYQDLILVECLKSNAAYAAWQRTGEVCDAIVAMGLHQGNPVDADTPFWLSELRKKIFISVYGRDKACATFLGRPPRLSYRYCKMELPLDLSDDQLFLEGAELDAVLNSLDTNGWNTTGNLQRTTWLRVWFQHCKIREEILEIALGSEDEDILERTQNIRRKLDAMHATYPEFMRITPEEVLNCGEMGPGFGFANTERAAPQVNGIFTLCIHAGVTHTEFLLQRALINRKKTDYKELIPVSRRMLNLVLLAQSRRELFRDFQGDLTHLLVVHGLPSAGVLAVELLKQEQSRQYTPDILPRSETIQDLSVFVSSLSSVGPGEGSFSICNQGRRALRRLLDQILSPAHLQPVVTGARDGEGREIVGGGRVGFEEESLYFPTGNDADFLQWLENVDWGSVAGDRGA